MTNVNFAEMDERQLNKVNEISDEMLAEVTGGLNFTYTVYTKPEYVVFKFAVGQKVEAIRMVGLISKHVFTKQCLVLDRKAMPFESGFMAYYLLSCPYEEDFDSKWIPECKIEGGCKIN